MRWIDLQANTKLAVWHQVANERCHSSLLATRRFEGCQTAAEIQSRTLTRSTGCNGICVHASHLILRRKVNLTGTRLLPCALLLQGTMCFRGRRA